MFLLSFSLLSHFYLPLPCRLHALFAETRERTNLLLIFFRSLFDTHSRVRKIANYHPSGRLRVISNFGKENRELAKYKRRARLLVRPLSYFLPN